MACFQNSDMSQECVACVMPLDWPSPHLLLAIYNIHYIHGYVEGVVKNVSKPIRALPPAICLLTALGITKQMSK